MKFKKMMVVFCALILGIIITLSAINFQLLSVFNNERHSEERAVLKACYGIDVPSVEKLYINKKVQPDDLLNNLIRSCVKLNLNYGNETKIHPK